MVFEVLFGNLWNWFFGGFDLVLFLGFVYILLLGGVVLWVVIF